MVRFEKAASESAAVPSCSAHSSTCVKWGFNRGLEIQQGFSIHVLAELHVPWKLKLDFSVYQSGIEFNCPYSNRP
jgi:hypothetical protein